MKNINDILQEFEKEFRKYYEGIVPEEVIKGAVKWHSNFLIKACEESYDAGQKGLASGKPMEHFYNFFPAKPCTGTNCMEDNNGNVKHDKDCESFN